MSRRIRSKEGLLTNYGSDPGVGDSCIGRAVCRWSSDRYRRRAEEYHIPSGRLPLIPRTVAREPLLLGPCFYHSIDFRIRHETTAGPSPIIESQCGGTGFRRRFVTMFGIVAARVSTFSTRQGDGALLDVNAAQRRALGHGPHVLVERYASANAGRR